jgi:hypothetical protein
MKDFCQGRQETGTLALFQYFIPCFIGKKKFKMKLCEQLKDDADICTVSDEVFTLLLLENQYDCWLDIYEAQKKVDKTSQA